MTAARSTRIGSVSHKTQGSGDREYDENGTNDYNARNIDELRTNGGRVGGNFEDAPITLSAGRQGASAEAFLAGASAAGHTR
jgi:hypothetical protein